MRHESLVNTGWEKPLKPLEKAGHYGDHYKGQCWGGAAKSPLPHSPGLLHHSIDKRSRAAMGDPSKGFRIQGALLECFMTYPQFKEDIEVLIAEGYVKITGSETCKWTKTKTSLAEYFKWAGYDAEWVTGGFWAPISKCFGEDRRSLSRLAGNNANPLKPEFSKDFIKIKAILEKHRKKERTKQTERRIYNYIKKLVLFADDEEPETIHEVVHKIGMIFLKNVDKNVQKRR